MDKEITSNSLQSKAIDKAILQEVINDRTIDEFIAIADQLDKVNKLIIRSKSLTNNRKNLLIGQINTVLLKNIYDLMEIDKIE